MTDKEIIKALEISSVALMYDEKVSLYKLALDLINRQQAERETMLKDLQFRTNQVIEQQAEIEKQERKTDVVIENYQNLCDRYIEARAEAIKEFAERLREKAEFVGIDQEGDFLYSEFDEFQLHDSVADVIEFLSKIAIKEMVGDDK